MERLGTAASDSSGTKVQVAPEDAAAVAVRVRELLHQTKQAVLQAERQEVSVAVLVEKNT
jgi:predicted HicB family RNase H-like nuclease